MKENIRSERMLRFFRRLKENIKNERDATKCKGY
jgi:hypothetical protein